MFLVFKSWYEWLDPFRTRNCAIQFSCYLYIFWHSWPFGRFWKKHLLQKKSLKIRYIFWSWSIQFVFENILPPLNYRPHVTAATDTCSTVEENMHPFFTKSMRLHIDASGNWYTYLVLLFTALDVQLFIITNNNSNSNLSTITKLFSLCLDACLSA